MGKKKDGGGQQLGRAIIKDRFGKGKGKSRKGDPTMVSISATFFFIKIIGSLQSLQFIKNGSALSTFPVAYIRT